MTATSERVTTAPVLYHQRVSGEQSVNSAEAEEFLNLMFEEGAAEQGTWLETRLAEVRAEIAETGTYRHTPAELAYGARVAWRNSARCIGRLYWNSLRVRDRRRVTDPADIAA